MVTAARPASLLPLASSDAARTSVLVAALDRLKRRPALTEAQADALHRLEAIRQDAKDAPKKAAAEKVAFLRNKLKALKLAADAAAATGDPKLARAAIHEMRALIKELAGALSAAGIAQGAAAPEMAASKTATPDAKPDVDAEAPTEADAEAGAATVTEPDAFTNAGKSPAAGASPPVDELDQARKDARDLVKELKKIAARLKMVLVATLTRGADPKAAKEAERNLRDGDQELQSLAGALATGATVDLRA